MPYREIVGLTPADAGTPVERLIAEAVLERVHDNTEAAYAEAEREARRNGR